MTPSLCVLGVRFGTNRDHDLWSHEGEENSQMRRRLATVLSGALLATMLMVPAAQADTPDPTTTPGLPGCDGNIVATFNHGSGQTANDSRGPGFFFRDGQVTKAAIADARAGFC